jgi:hypothetical protein
MVDENHLSLSNSKHLFKIKCDNNDEHILYGRPCELSAFSYVPLTRDYETSQRSTYQSKKSINDKKPFNYDSIFNIDYDFNNKTHRCDRKHAKLQKLDVWNEEIKKNYVTKSSSEYGKHILSLNTPLNSEAPLKVKYENILDPPERKHVRIGTVKSEFYNRNGINDLQGGK